MNSEDKNDPIADESKETNSPPENKKEAESDALPEPSGKPIIVSDNLEANSLKNDEEKDLADSLANGVDSGEQSSSAPQSQNQVDSQVKESTPPQNLRALLQAA